MATATNVRLLRQEERHGDLIYRIRVYQFDIDIGSIATNSLDVSTATLPGVDPATDFVMGVQHTDDIEHAVVHEFHIGATDTLHILSHNNTAGPIDQPNLTMRVVIARLKV